MQGADGAGCLWLGRGGAVRSFEGATFPFVKPQHSTNLTPAKSKTRNIRGLDASSSKDKTMTNEFA